MFTLPVQKLDLSNIVNSNSAFPLSAASISLVSVPVTARNTPTTRVSCYAFAPIVNLSATQFKSSNSNVISVSSGYLQLISSGTAQISAFNSGNNTRFITVCQAASAVQSITVNNVFKNSQWFNL